MAPVTELTVGQVAARSGVAVSALHFYEARGLIRSHRTSGNQRRYGRDVLRRVAIIKVAQQVGISLAEIGSALESLLKAARRRAMTGTCFRPPGAMGSTRRSPS